MGCECRLSLHSRNPPDGGSISAFPDCVSTRQNFRPCLTSLTFPLIDPPVPSRYGVPHVPHVCLYSDHKVKSHNLLSTSFIPPLLSTGLRTARERRRTLRSSSTNRGTDPSATQAAHWPTRWARCQRALAGLADDEWPVAGRSWPPQSHRAACSKTDPPARWCVCHCATEGAQQFLDHQHREGRVSGACEAAVVYHS